MRAHIQITHTQRPMIAERFLSIPIDIIDKELYERPPGVAKGLDPKDAALFLDMGSSSAKVSNSFDWQMETASPTGLWEAFC